MSTVNSGGFFDVSNLPKDFIQVPNHLPIEDKLSKNNQNQEIEVSHSGTFQDGTSEH